MPKFSVPRIKRCSTPNCKELALLKDGKCTQHSRKLYVYGCASAEGITNPFGVEIECLGPDDIRHVHDYVSGDGSLSYNGHEIKVLDDASKIGRTCASIAVKTKRLGGRVNRSCGLHVHMSMTREARQLRASQVFDKIKPAILAMENQMFDLFPTRYGNEYCHSIDSDYADYDDHYNWCGTSTRYPTIEIRIHPGTLSPHKLIGWTEVCKGLQKVFNDCILNKDTVRRKKIMSGDVLSVFRKDSIARKYLESRVAEPRNNRFRLP